MSARLIPTDQSSPASVTHRLAGPLVVVALAAVSLAGCRQDYLNNRDTLELTAGSAMQGNAVVNTVDPWPHHASKTTQDTDARKAQNALEIYREKPRDRQSTTTRSKTTNAN
ncbi:MAG: hypothetical protein AAFZ01_06335 [Pseudomonadota bacterium]